MRSVTLALLIGLIWSASATAHVNCGGQVAVELQGCCGVSDSLNLDPSDVSHSEAGDVWMVNLDGAWRPVVDYHTGKPIQLLPQTDDAHPACYTVWYRRINDSGLSIDHNGRGDFIFYCLQGPLLF